MKRLMIAVLTLAAMAAPALAQSDAGDYAYQEGPGSRDYGYVGDQGAHGGRYASSYGYGSYAYGRYAAPAYGPQGYGDGYGRAPAYGYGYSRGYGSGYDRYGYGANSQYGDSWRPRRRHRCGCAYYDDDYR